MQTSKPRKEYDGAKTAMCIASLFIEIEMIDIDGISRPAQVTKVSVYG